MADTKVSELPAATTVTVGDAIILNQSGITKKIPVETFFTKIPVEPKTSLSPEALGGGAISTTAKTSVIESASSSNLAFTLATGAEGAEKEIVVKSLVSTFSATITVTGGKGFSTITFSNVGQSVLLRFISSNWYVISYRGAVIA